MTLEQQIIEEGARFDRTVGQVAEMCKQAIDGLKYPRWQSAEVRLDAYTFPRAIYSGTHRGARVTAVWGVNGQLTVSVTDADLTVHYHAFPITTRSGFNIVINRVTRALDAAAEEV